MYLNDFNAVAGSAAAKADFLKKNPAGYVISSFLAGFFIAIGGILMGFVGGILTGLPAQKLVSGIVFSVGLCLVTMAGAELFTGNNMVMSIGSMQKTVTWGQTFRLWAVCYIGNLLGSVVAAVIFTLTAIPASGAVGEFFVNATMNKISGAPLALFAKGIMCNILVCLAVWCASRMKSEGAKIAMNFCCVGTFVTCGFEHCVANMSLLTIGYLNAGDAAITVGGMLYNLLVVTLGNMVGGILFVAVPYYFISREK